MSEVFEKIKQLLDAQKVQYTLTEHEPVRTSIEAAQIRGVDLSTGAKAMVVKANNQYYLIVIPADRKIDWKLVKSLLNTKEIRFATEEEAEQVTQVKMGSVPPFGNILGLPTYFDQLIRDKETVHFNPGSLRHSIGMKAADLIRLVSPTISSVSKE